MTHESPARDAVGLATGELRSYLNSRQYADEDAAVDLDDAQPLLTVGSLRTILAALTTPSQDYARGKVERLKSIIRDAGAVLGVDLDGKCPICGGIEGCSHTLAERISAALTPAQPQERVVPIPMILICPDCGDQHIDEPSEGWDNPPHRSHLCHSCGCIWRPADVATVGVRSIETKGKADNWDASLAAAPKEANRG
jgi:hypothetical protein